MLHLQESLRCVQKGVASQCQTHGIAALFRGTTALSFGFCGTVAPPLNHQWHRSATVWCRSASHSIVLRPWYQTLKSVEQHAKFLDRDLLPLVFKFSCAHLKGDKIP